MSAPILSLRNISKRYSRKGTTDHGVLLSLSLDVAEGQFVSVLGPSGGGKTTLLNLIAGLESPTSGEVFFEGEKVKPLKRPQFFRTEQHPVNPKVSFVFQQPALLPWRTVLQNVSLPLELSGEKRLIYSQSALSALTSVGLKDVANSYPHTLSGGMRSRVAIARAMIQNPRLLLMDEPFSSLDPIMRETFDINLMRFCANRNVTGVFVTHSVTEACLLAHKVLIVDEGRIVDTLSVDVPWPRTREVLSDEKFLEAVKRVRQSLLKTSMSDPMPQPRYDSDKDMFVDAFEKPIEPGETP